MTEENVTAVVLLDDDYVAPPPAGMEIQTARQSGLVEMPQGGPLAGLAQNNQGAAMMAREMAEIKNQMEMARAFPREKYVTETAVYKACQDPEFAEVAIYSFPRGKGEKKTTIQGASIKLAEELGRHWTNLNWGFQVIADDDQYRTIRCFAHDLESNTKKFADVTFQKTHQRVVNGQAVWVQPDPRDLLELTNSQASRGVRNAILGMIPDGLKRNAMSWCKQTMARKDAENPDAWRTRLANWFSKRGIGPKDIENFMGLPIEKIHEAEDIAYIRGIANRIREGDAKWSDILRERAEALGVEGPPPQNASELRQRISERAAAATRRPGKKENQ